MIFKTTWGDIAIDLENGCVKKCTLPFLKHTPNLNFEIEEFGSLAHLIKAFSEVASPKGTSFQQDVWQQIGEIPYGKTRTYGDIAKNINRPKAVRAVGTACGANPIPLFIPCHRVVSKDGLGGFGAGLPWKKLLLEMER